MAWTACVWFDEMYRQALKPIFGNYRNFLRYLEICRIWELKNYLISLGMRY